PLIRDQTAFSRLWNFSTWQSSAGLAKLADNPNHPAKVESPMTQASRPDVDIEEEIHNLITHYPPLQADRHHFECEVNNGVVTFSGHVKSMISRRYLVDHTAEVRGVRSVESKALYTEEDIRLEAGRRIPTGVIANASYDAVILTGALPQGKSVEDVVKEV